MSMASEAEVAGVIAQVTERTPVEVRFGVVESITLSGTYPTVGVTLGRDDGLYPVQLRYMASYSPLIGDVVYVLQFGGDPVVLGCLRGGVLDGGHPAGEVIAYAGTSTPAGYLPCDGGTYNRTDYVQLFAAIGTAWGAPSGSTFKVPDLRGRVLVGAGTGSGLTARALGATGGDEDLQSHAHSIAQHGHPGQISAGPAAGTGATGFVIASTFTGNTGGPTATGTQGTGTALNMPPFAVMNYCIKT